MYARLLQLWGNEEEKTRLGSHKELAQIIYYVEAVRGKAASFDKMAKADGAVELSYTKSKIFNAMLERIDEAVDGYNSHARSPNNDKETQDTINLVKRLTDIVYDVTVNYSALLGLSRDEHKKYAGVAADVVTFTAILTGGVFASVPVVLTAFGAYMMSPKVGKNSEIYRWSRSS